MLRLLPPEVVFLREHRRHGVLLGFRAYQRPSRGSGPVRLCFMPAVWANDG